MKEHVFIRIATQKYRHAKQNTLQPKKLLSWVAHTLTQSNNYRFRNTDIYKLIQTEYGELE